MPAFKQSTLSLQQGATVLTTVVLLLVIASTVALYSARIRLMEHRITLNTLNYSQAFQAAQSALNKFSSTLLATPLWNGNQLVETLPSQASYDLLAYRESLDVNGVNLDLVSLTTEGVSSDRQASVNMSEQLVVFPVLKAIAPAPLIVQGEIIAATDVKLVANPNGGGLGVPVSLWSNTHVDMASFQGVTCGLQEHQLQRCALDAYSEQHYKGVDIVDTASVFPDDIIEYFFSVPIDELNTLLAHSVTYVSDCYGLNGDSSGLIWVTGDCQLLPSTDLGTAENPVVLLVVDGDLMALSANTIYGLVGFIKDSAQSTHFSVELSSDSTIVGALFANQDIGNNVATFTIEYAHSVLDALTTSENLLTVARVVGSWRDF